MIDFTKCHCEQPGFCPIFMRRMGTDPPDWNWCQKNTTSQEDRRLYYDILCRSSNTENKKLVNFFSRLDDLHIDKKFYLFYYLTMSERYNKCNKAQITQFNINKKNIDYLNKNKFPSDNTNIEIACLGHSDKQFNTIIDRYYLKKINLNHIDAGRFSHNKWAEARAFISNTKLFTSSAQFIGFVTASWNIKYEPYSRIDFLHNWTTTNILLNSEPEDQVILCADIFCPCVWFPPEDKDSRGCVLDLFFGDNSIIIANKFKELFNIQITEHVKVPFANQIICHKSIVDSYQKYLFREKIFDKIIWLVEDFAKEYVLEHKDQIQKEYLNDRIYAYLVEAITCFWFYNNRERMIFLPNAERLSNWYYPELIKERTRWNTIS